MKTHTSRWVEERPGKWVLKARGGAILATLYDDHWPPHWCLGEHPPLYSAPSKYAAQRAVRRALATSEQAALYGPARKEG